VRFYSLSRQLLTSRSEYYDVLNQTQRGDVDVTLWVQWFARQCTAAFDTASKVIQRTAPALSHAFRSLPSPEPVMALQMRREL
jgi:Fic family protein